MEVQRTLIDRQFDRYVLSADGAEKREQALPTAVLEPLDAANTPRKAQWEARVHQNGLTADPQRSDALQQSVAYYLDEGFRVMEVVWNKTAGLRASPICPLPKPHQRKENATLRVAGLGLLVMHDGNDTVRILKSRNAAVEGASWDILYEFQPVERVTALVLSASYDETLLRFDVMLAEPLTGADKNAAYRLWVVEVASVATSESMCVDSGFVGVEHHAFEVGITSTLPHVVSLNGHELVLLVEGPHSVMIEDKTPASGVVAPLAVEISNEQSGHASKRHHDESDLEMDVDEVLAKVPRAGIGYHGDVPDLKHAHELAHDDDFAKPLAERFRKSSIPYSSLDEPLHSTSREAVTSPKMQARGGPLEIPTPETILGGFEECDDVDPNATATLLLIDAQHQLLKDKLDINCRSFRYLGTAGGATKAAATLLFQHDVHGLVFDLTTATLSLKLQHTATFPAFGFVQASKQDKKYLSYDAGGRFSCIGEFEKRVFVYHGQPFDMEADSHERKQNVVEIGDHQLLGMCVVGTSILLLSPHHVYHMDVSSH